MSEAINKIVKNVPLFENLIIVKSRIPIGGTITKLFLRVKPHEATQCDLQIIFNSIIVSVAGINFTNETLITKNFSSVVEKNDHVFIRCANFSQGSYLDFIDVYFEVN